MRWIGLLGGVRWVDAGLVLRSDWKDDSLLCCRPTHALPCWRDEDEALKVRNIPIVRLP